jgi:hypothetical protein
MNRLTLSALVWLTIAVLAPAQIAPPTIYAESFRQGSTRVTEETFEARLTPDDANYRERIKDSRGEDRYELTIAPRMPGGDDRITSWDVTLRDLRHSSYGNILVAEQKPSENAKNNLWRLDPNRLGPVPIRAKRIMRVDEFYVAIQVKDFHFTPTDSPYLDSMVVQFAFSNNDLRSSGEAAASK